MCWLQNRRYELSPTPNQRDKKKVVALTKRFKDKVIFLAAVSVIHPGWPCRLVSLSVSSLGSKYVSYGFECYKIKGRHKNKTVKSSK